MQDLFDYLFTQYMKDPLPVIGPSEFDAAMTFCRNILKTNPPATTVSYLGEGCLGGIGITLQDHTIVAVCSSSVDVPAPDSQFITVLGGYREYPGAAPAIEVMGESRPSPFQTTVRY